MNFYNRKKKKWQKGNKIYHLSYDNHDGETFYPRIPNHGLSPEEENSTIARVCFSNSISGAFRAIYFKENIDVEMYVHVPVNENTKFYKPGGDMLYDSETTGEVWVTRPVKLKCIGKVRIKLPYHRYRWYLTPKIRFQWLEKNNNVKLNKNIYLTAK